MKKNRMMRLASMLLVAVLITTSTISGTFAKYVTQGSANDSARVAKFGVTVIGTSDSMFANEYSGTTYHDAVSDTDMDLTVQSTVKVVAPGTNGTFTNFDIEGTPEVAVRVTYENVVVDFGNNWVDKLDLTKFYCPIVVTVNGTDFCGLSYHNPADFAADITTKIEAATKEYKPNTDLDVADADLNVSWRWDFDDDAHTHCDYKQLDEKDTFLGDRAAGDVANAGTISVSMDCVVTQID